LRLFVAKPPNPNLAADEFPFDGYWRSEDGDGMADTIEYDLIVIGGGPAGYAGAIRAGQLGKKVACIELERAGGTCLNWGCIPTKALLKSAELYQKIKKADVFGITVKDVSFDFAKVMERSRGVAGQMAKGVEFLFKKNKVDYFVGKGQVTVPGMVEITEGEHKGKFFKAKNILIATGCRMRRLPDLAVDGAWCDHQAARGLLTQGLIRPAFRGAIGELVPAELTESGRAFPRVSTLPDARVVASGRR